MTLQIGCNLVSSYQYVHFAFSESHPNATGTVGMRSGVGTYLEIGKRVPSGLRCRLIAELHSSYHEFSRTSEHDIADDISLIMYSRNTY